MFKRVGKLHIRTSLALVLVVLLGFSGLSHAREDLDKTLLIPVHIEKGTSLIRLAREFCTSKYHWKELAKINGLNPPYMIYAGETIHIPFDLLKRERVSARIASVIGGVFWMKKDGSLQQIGKGENILPGQTLVTEKDGFAHLILPDNRYIRISSNSKFTLTYLLRLTDHSLKAEFFLERGNISLDVRQKLKKNETFNARTPVSVTGVRGTSYRVKMDGDTNIVETLRGKVALSAGGTMVLIKEGKGSMVKKGEAPSAPQSLPAAPPLPVMEKIYREVTLRIPVPVIAEGHCLLRITSDEAGEKTIWQGRAAKGEDFVITGFEDGHYYAFFTAVNSVQLEGKVAGPVAFQLRTTPSAPILRSRCDGMSIFGSSFDIRWLGVEGAVKYFTQVAEDESFENLLTEVEVEKTEYRQSGIAPGKYYFRVQSIAEDGFRSDFSCVDSVVMKEMPSMGALPAPSSGKEVALRWHEMGEDVLYDIQIAKDAGFSRVVSSATGLQQAEFSPESLEPGRYWVRMRVTLATGEVSPWTPTQELVVPPPSFGMADGIILGLFLTLMVL